MTPMGANGGLSEGSQALDRLKTNFEPGPKPSLVVLTPRMAAD